MSIVKNNLKTNIRECILFVICSYYRVIVLHLSCLSRRVVPDIEP